VASTPIRNFVKRQIAAQGGYLVLVERMRAGETVAEMARTFFRPDGKAIGDRTLGWLMHREPGIRQAMQAALAEWRTQSEWSRRQQRKAIRAGREGRRMKAWLAMPDTAPTTRQPVPTQTDFSTGPESFSWLRHREAASPPVIRQLPVRSAPRPIPPPPAPIPEPEPPAPPRPTGVDWDERTQQHWCYDCERRDCIHIKREYMRRAQAYANEQNRFKPFVNRGLV